MKCSKSFYAALTGHFSSSLSRQTSSFLDVTPSPIKLMENPLGAFIKRESDEVTSCCAAVKQEVESSLSETGGEAQNVKDEVQVKMEGETSAIS